MGGKGKGSRNKGMLVRVHPKVVSSFPGWTEEDVLVTNVKLHSTMHDEPGFIAAAAAAACVDGKGKEDKEPTVPCDPPFDGLSFAEETKFMDAGEETNSVAMMKEGYSELGLGLGLGLELGLGSLGPSSS